MLDLKAKLASAGLVSEDDIKRVEREKTRGSSKRRGSGARKAGGGSAKRAGLDVASLQKASKSELYLATRKWVEKVRIDNPSVPPSVDAKVYHFPEDTGRIGRLVLEPPAHELVSKGEAAVVTYMSNHGRAHAVVPAQGARALAQVKPLWLRVLVGDASAGQIERPEPESEPEPEPSTTDGAGAEADAT